MGLDMYLKTRFNLGHWRHEGEAEKAKFMAVATAAGLSHGDWSEESPMMSVEVTIGYWRKVNAVHQWFVENVQDGEDDCGMYHVTREKLEELVTVCNAALGCKKKGDATEYLPPTSGFFFGSTEVDASYFADIQRTVLIVRAALDNPKFKDTSFFYRSSW